MSSPDHRSQNAERETRVLVVGPSWVGDAVMAQSLFRILKAQHSSIRIDVLAPAWTRMLLQRMPEVEQGVDMPVGHGRLALGKRYQLARRLRRAGYDWAIVLPNSFKSALVPAWARIPRRTGYLGELRWGLLTDVRRLDPTQLPTTVQRFAALGLPRDVRLPDKIPVPRLAVDGTQLGSTLERLALEPPAGRLLILCPGAEFGPAKRWPPEYFAEVARAKLAEGWTVWVLGSEADTEPAGDVCRRAGDGCVNLAGMTQLSEAIDLMAMSSVVVTNDSGLMHVAAALGRPVVAVFGSSDPGFTPPLSDNAKVLSLSLECSPCFKRECPLGHLRCLRDLHPNLAVDAIKRLVG